MLVHFRDTNKVIYIRLFELGVELAICSEGLCKSIAKPIITQVFGDFFDMLDILTQVTIMDFVGKLAANEHALKLMNESQFIDLLFSRFGGQNDDSFSFLTSNMLLVGAKIYSEDPTAFEVFENENYM